MGLSKTPARNDEETSMLSGKNSVNISKPNINVNVNKNINKKSHIKGILAQALLTGAVMLNAAACGMPIGYSAVLLPQLKTEPENSTLYVDEDMSSWIASMHSAATPIGSLLSGLIMDRFGRKLALQISILPLLAGWSMIYFCQNHFLLLFGRLVAGAAVGLGAAPGGVYISETSEAKFRGIFSSVPFASYSFGILLVYALGSVLHWRLVAALSIVLPLISITAFCFLPETPIWLVRKGRLEEGRKSMMWLRGNDIMETKQEIQQLITRVENETKAQTKKKSYREMFREPHVLKPIIIINVFNLMQTLSGTFLVVFYAVDILSQIGGDNVDNFVAAVLTACVRFMFTIVATVFLGVIGRRPLALTSAVGTAVSAIVLGTLLALQQPDSSIYYSYLSAICVLIYIATNTVGFMVLPAMMLGELYPAKIRGFAGGLTFMVFHITLFGATKVFPYVKDAIGIHGVFWLFGSCSLLASVFLYLMLPETKGKTLNEIEDYFMEKHVMWISRKKHSQQSSDSESV